MDRRGLGERLTGRAGISLIVGHPVPTDLLRPEPRHQADRQASRHRRQEDQQRLMVARARRDEARADALVEDEIGQQSDEPQKRQRRDRAGGADRHRPRDDPQHPRAQREVPEMATRSRQRGSNDPIVLEYLRSHPPADA